MDSPTVLLTNDDGIDSPGLIALHEGLTDLVDVVVVAPASDQSAVGRSISGEVDVTDRDRGYAVAGTPADCIVAGLESFVPDAKLVISGCNRGANLGRYVVGRSGTVGAALEAAFFDVPAIAVSQYVAMSGDITWADHELPREAYREAIQATRYLVEHALHGELFSSYDVLNVNLPDANQPVQGMRVTRPSTAYDMAAEREGDRMTLVDQVWERMAQGEVSEPEGTDRQAIQQGYVSLTPLTAPQATEGGSALRNLAADYKGNQRPS